jgi:hypothetical protein
MFLGLMFEVDFVHNLPVTSFGFRDAHHKFMLGHIRELLHARSFLKVSVLL